MFNKAKIQENLKLEVAISDEMSRAIETWTTMYEGKPYTNNGDVFKRMDLASSISSELARLITLEFESEVTGNDFLNDQYQQALKQLRIYTEFACAKGGLVFKPYVNANNVEVDCVQADHFYPIAYNSRGEVTSAAFIECKQSGNDMYSRVEYHELTNDKYTITNKAYLKKNYTLSSDTNDLGYPVSLKEVDEWSTLEEIVVIQNVNKPLFVYFKMPFANHIDNKSPLGVSVFGRAIKDIEEADKQYDRILWEYESGERFVFADTGLFKRDKEGSAVLPSGKERLFRVLDFDDDDMLKEHSPEMRESSLFTGLNQLLRKIEFKCGLAYRTLSDVQDSEKTAEEIKSSKQRSYSTVKDIQRSLQTALEELVEAMDVLAKLYQLSNQAYDITFNWDDSLIMNKDAELASMQADVVAGLLRPELYLSKKYGCSVEEALKMMPNVEDSVKSPYFGFEE